MVGAFLGAVLALAGLQAAVRRARRPGGHARHLLHRPDHPQAGWNVVTEVIGTFVLVSWILLSPGAKDAADGVPQLGNSALGYAGVAFVVIGIGASLGGPTGLRHQPGP